MAQSMVQDIQVVIKILNNFFIKQIDDVSRLLIRPYEYINTVIILRGCLNFIQSINHMTKSLSIVLEGLQWTEKLKRNKTNLSNNHCITFRYTKFHERLIHTTSLKNMLESSLGFNIPVKQALIYPWRGAAISATKLILIHILIKHISGVLTQRREWSFWSSYDVTIF